jgi:hypothetical protein
MVSDGRAVSDPEVPTLADAADDLCLLAEHDRLVTKAWALDVDELRDLVARTGVAGRRRSRLLRQLDELRIARAALGQREPDTPASGCGPECSEHHTFEPPCEAWIDSTDAINVPTPRGEPLPEQRAKVPATPGGGERLTWSEYVERYTPSRGIEANESFAMRANVVSVNHPIPGARDKAPEGKSETPEEVAVVRVDSLPTRQEVRRAISQAGYSPEYAYRRARTRIDRMTDAVMFLLGQTEEDDR